MTFQPSDAPDWTGIPGGLRYLGTINMTGTGNITHDLDISPASYDGAVYVIQTGSPLSLDLYARILLVNNDNSVRTAQAYVYRQGQFLEEPFVGFWSSGLGTDWTVTAEVNNADASTWQLWVFAAPTFPLASIVRDQMPMLVRQDGVPFRKIYADKTFHNPGAGVKATLTFPADANGTLGWVLDHASWTLIGHGTVASNLARIVDGATVIHSQRLQSTIVDGVVDRYSVGPMSGYASAPGAALTVDFSVAPAATSVQAISAGAYTYAILA